MNYVEADLQLQGRNYLSRKYANNTYLQRRGADIALLLHATDIVTWKPNGDTVLDSGGWRTVTTKERMNRVIDLIITQKQGRWFMLNGNVLYQDGMILKADGTIEGAGEYLPKADKNLKARIRIFSKLCADAIPLGMPGPGDCWYCGMQTSDGQSLGDATKDTEHLESHIEENYVVPSLVWQAMESCGYQPERNMQFGIVFGEHKDFGNIGHDTVKRSVYRYMSKQLGFAA